MKTFHKDNKLTLNDVVEGLLEGKEFWFEFYCFGDHYEERIIGFSGLSKFIKTFDYMNIKIEEV